jgi:hypothetical protein
VARRYLPVLASSRALWDDVSGGMNREGSLVVTGKQHRPFWVASLGALASLAVASLAVAPWDAGAQATMAAVAPAVLPAGTRSVEAVRSLIVRMGPQPAAAIRGRVRGDTRLPARTAIRTTDQCGYWVAVGIDAWACGTEVRPSTREPEGRPFPSVSRRGLLPHSYLIVPDGGVDAYRSEEAARARVPAERLPGGWMRRVFSVPGGDLVRTSEGLFLHRDEVRRLGGSPFQGVELATPDRLTTLGFVARDRVRTLHANRRQQRTLTRLGALEITGEPEPGVLLLADGQRVAARDVVRPRLAARPAAVAAIERWVDVDVGTQTMVVYEGDRPVYATLVSTGRRERDHATPLGEFRIWVKVGETTMDDIGNEDAAEDYSVEAVPWVQYFDGSIAFHAAYWHRRFGNRMSHGCVNLSPKDARWLYGFTSPTVPDGWVAVHPTDNERGTFVRVRDSAG